jgi:hypothetical protein
MPHRLTRAQILTEYQVSPTYHGACNGPARGRYADGCLTTGGRLVLSDSCGPLSHLRPRVVKALPGGGFGYLPRYNHLASHCLAAALPPGLQVRRCQEPCFGTR